jgi:hypothetical protein
LPKFLPQLWQSRYIKVYSRTPEMISTRPDGDWSADEVDV